MTTTDCPVCRLPVERPDDQGRHPHCAEHAARLSTKLCPHGRRRELIGCRACDQNDALRARIAKLDALPHCPVCALPVPDGVAVDEHGRHVECGRRVDERRVVVHCPECGTTVSVRHDATEPPLCSWCTRAAVERDNRADAVKAAHRRGLINRSPTFTRADFGLDDDGPVEIIGPDVKETP